MRALSDGQIYQDIGMKALDPEACAAIDRIYDEITEQQMKEYIRDHAMPSHLREMIRNQKMLKALTPNDDWLHEKLREASDQSKLDDKDFFNMWTAGEKIPMNNLCQEISIDDGASRCVLGMFYSAEAIIALPSNLYAHADIKLRQFFSPEGKLVTASYSGHTLKDHTAEEISAVDELVADFIKEHAELSKEQFETFYRAIVSIRVLRYLGNNLPTGAGKIFTTYHLSNRDEGKLPEIYQTWVDKNLPLYDTECVETPKWVFPEINAGIPLGGFKRGELALLNTPISPETRWKATNPIANLRRKIASGEEVVLYDTEATITDQDLEKHCKNLGIEMNPNVERLYANSEFGAIAERVEAYEKEPAEVSGIETNFPKRRKSSKSKKRSKHITNCRSGFAHKLMGMSILAKLGKHQQDFQDGVKKEILQNHTLSSFVETVSGQAIPEYQKRLLDLNQQRHDNPTYEPDDGPLTDKQIEAIRETSSATGTPDEAYDQRLFEETTDVEKSEQSTV